MDDQCRRNNVYFELIRYILVNIITNNRRMLKNMLIFACVLTADRYICDGNMESIPVYFDSFLFYSGHIVSFPIVNAFCAFQMDVDVVFLGSIIDHKEAIFFIY